MGTAISGNVTVGLAGSTYSLGTLNFSNTAGTYNVGSSINDGTLLFQGGNTITNSAAVTFINSAVQMTGATTINTSGILAMYGNISEAYYSTITKLGTGTLILSGVNSFTGGVAISVGTVLVASNSALGSGSTSVSSGASLDLFAGALVNPSNFSVGGTGVGGGGAIQSLAGSANTLTTGNMSLTANTLITTTANLTINAPITANYNLTNQGSGNLTLANSLSGSGQVIQNGTGNLNFTGASSIYPSALIANAGNINLGLTGGSTVGSPLSVGGAGSTASITLLGSNQIASYETMTVGTLGTFNLNGYSNTLSSIALTAGTITTGTGTLTLSSATPLTISASGTASTINGNVVLSAYNPTVNGTASSSLTINGALTSTSGLTKSGSGTLTLSGASSNVTSGTVTVSGGTLALAKTGGALAISSGTSLAINTGGTLLFQGSNQISASDPINLGGGKITAQSGSNSLGALTLSASSTIDFSGASTSLKFADSSATTWAGILTIDDWTSSDTLSFGTTASGLTTAQLNDISFNIGGTLYMGKISSSGVVTPLVPVPEASPFLYLALLLGLVFITELGCNFRKAPSDDNFQPGRP
jgi:autotransporter-associated beta strand protein